MFRFSKLIFKLVFVCFFSQNFCLAARNELAISGFRSSIYKVIPTIERAAETVKNLFIQNNESNLGSQFIILNSSNGDEYLDLIKTHVNYRILIKFKNSITNTANGYDPWFFETKQIVLIPIFSSFTSVAEGVTSSKKIISGFDCVTDMDENIKLFLGDSEAQEGSRSIISNSIKNEDTNLLGNCLYLKSSTIRASIFPY